MSKAFTKEPEGGDVYDDLPDRPISPHNLVTPKGLEMIEAELARLHAEHAAAQDADDRAWLAKINRDLRYWTSRRATAQVMEQPTDRTEVHFGSTVTILREEILAVISKHVQLDADKVQVKLDRDKTMSLLEIDVEIPLNTVSHAA